MITISYPCSCGTEHPARGVPVPNHPGLALATVDTAPCGAFREHSAIIHVRSGLALMHLEHPEQGPAAIAVLDRHMPGLDWTLTAAELAPLTSVAGPACTREWVEATGVRWTSYPAPEEVLHR